MDKYIKMIGFWLVLISALVTPLGGSEIIRPGSNGDNKLLGEKDDEITIKWDVDKVFQDTSLKLYYNGKTDDDLLAIIPYATATTIEVPMTVWNKINKFKGKIKGVCTIINGKGSCNVTIMNLQYNDAGVFKFINLDRYKDYSEDEVHLDVKGGPEHCGNQYFAPNTTVLLGSEINGNVTLCGKPKPNLQWFVGDEKINGTIDFGQKEEHQYSYSFKLLATEVLQGKNITYRAIGYKNREVKGKTTLLIIMPLLGDDVENTLSFGAIIGIVISILIAVIIISIAILYYRGTIGNRKSGGVIVNEEGISMAREENV